MHELFATQLEPITMKDRVVDLIRQAIFSGKLSAGERIVELRLAKQLGLGTTSVREALYELERHGFVTRIANKGVYVTQLSEEDTRQIYRVRTELEGLAVELLKEHIKAADIQALQKLINEMKAAAREGNLTRFYENDLEFHRSLWLLSLNQYVIRFLESMVVPLFAFYIMRTRQDSRELLWSVKRHERVLHAIKTQSPAGARKVMEESLQLFWEQQKRLLSGQRQKSPVKIALNYSLTRPFSLPVVREKRK